MTPELTSCQAACDDVPSLTLAVSGPGNHGTECACKQGAYILTGKIIHVEEWWPEKGHLGPEGYRDGRFDKPLILAKPSSMVAPGTNVTLHCWMMESTLQEVTFTLWMVGRLANAQKQAEREAKFSLPSVSLDNAGSYICAYSEKGEPKRMSEASDILDLVVTGSFPKPSFLAHPSPNVVLGEHVVLRCTLPLPRSSPKNYPTRPSLTVQPGSSVSLGQNVTLHCQGSACGTSFALYKEGEEMPVGTVDCTQDEAEFLITRVTHNRTGSDRCRRHTGEPDLSPSGFSDLLQLEAQNGAWRG
ncbi:T-cell-interacting, activating receptor on myeloid cells protein 1-like [Phascolarctos cinereus]